MCQQRQKISLSYNYEHRTQIFFFAKTVVPIQEHADCKKKTVSAYLLYFWFAELMLL